MARAIVPKEVPPLPDRAIAWRRSKRRGSMFHAIDALGVSVCGTISLDRNDSEAVSGLGDMQYWGCCPRCHRKALAGEVA